jgi:hypothetical protein
MTHHPLRDAKLHTFKRYDAHGRGVQWVAMFHPYNKYPMFISGDTEEEVSGKAEAFRQDAIDKYEANFIIKQLALEKARATRAAKKKAKEVECTPYS